MNIYIYNLYLNSMYSLLITNTSDYSMFCTRLCFNLISLSKCRKLLANTTSARSTQIELIKNPSIIYPHWQVYQLL